MTKLVKSTGWRVVRWCERLVEQKKAQGHWYDVDHCGVH